MAWSAECDLLECLAAADMTLREALLQFRGEHGRFLHSIYEMIKSGDIRLLQGSQEVPQWRQRELFEDGSAMNLLDDLTLQVTPQGARFA